MGGVVGRASVVGLGSVLHHSTAGRPCFLLTFPSFSSFSFLSSLGYGRESHAAGCRVFFFCIFFPFSSGVILWVVGKKPSLFATFELKLFSLSLSLSLYIYIYKIRGGGLANPYGMVQPSLIFFFFNRGVFKIKFFKIIIIIF